MRRLSVDLLHLQYRSEEGDNQPEQGKSMPNERTVVIQKQRRDTRQDTRARLVKAGLASVLEGGWAATGIEQVLRACEVPKGSFYHYFKSKDDFGFALIDAYQEFFVKRLDRCFGPANEDNLRKKFDAFLGESIEGMTRYAWRRGCLVGSLGQELAALNDEYRKRLEGVMREWETILEGAISRAQADGEIPRNAKPASLARNFWAAWEGAVLRARLLRSGTPLKAAVEDFSWLAHRDAANVN